MQAVITADVVNSTFIRTYDYERLVEKIKALFHAPNRIEFYRGDSFQVLVAKASEAYKYCLLCRFQAIGLSAGEQIDIRQSISLGEVKGNINQLGSHVEEVFVSSGRTFDKLSDSGRRLLITSGMADKDFAYELIARYTDNILSQVTAKQAIVLYHLLSGKNQLEIAKILNKTTATINQHVKTARFDEIQQLVQDYEHLTKQLENGK